MTYRIELPVFVAAEVAELAVKQGTNLQHWIKAAISGLMDVEDWLGRGLGACGPGRVSWDTDMPRGMVILVEIPEDVMLHMIRLAANRGDWLQHWVWCAISDEIGRERWLNLKTPQKVRWETNAADDVPEADK